MIVPQGVDCDTRQRIQVALALSIYKPAAFSVCKGNRLAGISVHHVGHGDFSVDKEWQAKSEKQKRRGCTLNLWITESPPHRVLKAFP
jgi:hypothetical protein